MALLTDRIGLTLTSDAKIRLKAKARERGMTLSALMREICEQAVAEDELAEAFAMIELRSATIQ